MAAKGKRKRLRPDRPLELEVTVETEVEHPARAPVLGRALGLCLRAVPTYRDVRSGRRKALVLRSLLLGGAAVLALMGPREIPTVAWVAALALGAARLPVRHHRHERSISWVRSLQEPTTVPGLAPASLHCDGAKITLTCKGRVWGSLRPAATGCELVFGRSGDEALLGLVPAREHKREPLWFVGSVDDLPPEATDGLKPLEMDRSRRPVQVSGSGWPALVEAFTDPRLLRSP